ncbi:hypothetical protein K1X09_23320 [Paenibacillus lautus]|nr:hypothetical protein [Paenibacillus lautus]
MYFSLNYILLFIELLFMKLMLYPLPTPTMKKDAMRRTSEADGSIPEKRMRSPLFPNF